MNAAVILAGGAGDRLFPYSTSTLPKQFLPLLGQRSMVQETYDRLRKTFPARDIYIVTQPAFRDTVVRQLPALTDKQLLIEPARRDTAGAIALALKQLQGTYDMVFVTPADHHLQDDQEWDQALQTALNHATKTASITLFGIVPNYPETGYGYIEYERSETNAACRVVRFHEKPSREVALNMVRSGHYLWNCGILVIPVNRGIQMFATHLPLHHQYILNHNATDADFLEIPSISIDYGLLEKIQDSLSVVPSYFAWNDLGSWHALEHILPKDEFGNNLHGDVRVLNAENSIVFSPDHEVYLYDVANLLIVCHDQQVLVASKEATKDMKAWLPQLRAKKGS